MAECRICGITYGRMDGGPEPYTGQNLLVCSSCGALFKKVNAAHKKKEFIECRNYLQTLVNTAKDPEVNAILAEYSQRLLKGIDPQVFAKKREEEEKQQKINEELKRSWEKQYAKNPLFEYAVETVTDSKTTGSFNQEQVQLVLSSYAANGWRLHSAFTNELGKNAIAALGIALNATVEQTVLIFERCIKDKQS